MLGKKVKLFGRSVSLSEIAALATVTMAAAVWGSRRSPSMSA